MLHILKTAAIQPKNLGMEWANKYLDTTWNETRDCAWSEHDGVRYGIKISQNTEDDVLYEILAFIRYAVSQMDRMDLES